MSTFEGPVSVYYWPMFGRAGSVVRMLEHAGVPYTFKSEFPEIAACGSAFGSTKQDTFAPPIVQDGEFFISQSTACALYVGEKCGLSAPNTAKCVQHLADIVDFFELGLAGTLSNKGSGELKKFIEGDRLPKQLGNLERAVQGPFFYGDKPTVTDFFLTQQVDWHEGTLLDRLKAEKGVDIFAAFPKLYAVATGIRNLDSYQKYSGPLKTVRDGFECKDETIANYA